MMSRTFNAACALLLLTGCASPTSSPGHHLSGGGAPDESDRVPLEPRPALAAPHAGGPEALAAAPAERFAAPAPAAASSKMVAHFINVGQGDAALLEFACGAVLIDVGAQNDEAADDLVQ